MSQPNKPVEKITVYGFGPLRLSDKVLDPCGFIMKVISFCLYHKIPFAFDATAKFSSKNGRCPWIKVEFANLGQNQLAPPPLIVDDSEKCIKALGELYNVDMDSHLTADQKVQSENLRYVVESVLYFALLRSIWVDNPQWVAREVGLAIPDFMRSFVLNQVRKDTITTLNLHGNGDLSDEESHAVAANIYRNIALILGDKKFLFSNERPSSVECGLLRYVDNIEDDEVTPAAVKKVFQENPRLVEYGRRLKAALLPAEAFKAKLAEGRKSNADGTAFVTGMMRKLGAVAVVVIGAAGYGVYQWLKAYHYI